MRRRLPRGFGLILGALLLLWVQLAAALSYYEPSPQGIIGLSRPTISQQFILEPGERITGAEMWVDGRVVHPTWDEAGRVSYTPPAPLTPGPHTVRLVVSISPDRPGYFFAPVESEFTFTVGQGAVAELPGPGPEERRALAWVNQYRKRAGLAPMAYDSRLAAAALSHARYLAAHPEQVEVDGHREEPGRSLFIGETVGDRARYFTYDGGAFEVINFVDRAEDAIDGWIDTLYHRIPLLHPGMAEMGYGVAGAPGQNVNVIEAGPFSSAEGVVRWPHGGQTGVPPLWDGLESPDPLDLYPGATKPVGYPITLTFGGQPRGLRLMAYSLTGPDGEVEVFRFDPVNDPRLEDTVCLIPKAPLRPGATYTVRMRGQADLGRGVQPFDETWSFTTAPEFRPFMRNRVATTGVPGNELRSVRVEGIGFGSGMKVFLGGLPVANLVVESERRFTFAPPAGYGGERADLLLVTPGGVEEVWYDFFQGDESMRLPEVPAFAQVPLLVRGQHLPQPSLFHPGGAVLLPEGALAKLGGAVERIPAIDRSYWKVGERTGEYTLGRLSASLGEKPLRLALPVQQRLGTIYVDAAFVQGLAGVESQLVAGELFVGSRILGLIDIEGHWALPAIRRLLEAKIVSGYGDGSFRPNASLSRSAFVKMLVGANGLALKQGDDGGFRDTASHWVSQQGYLGAAVGAGIIRPGEYPEGRFEPDRPVTREEIAVMVTRALGLEQQALSRRLELVGGTAVLAGKSFSDAGDWEKAGHIAVAVEAGIITGYSESDGRYTFRPARSATRAEAAVMVTRALDHR
ncbi:MAG: S-layer homology domain-containing protein [Bacillota bacterium]